MMKKLLAAIALCAVTASPAFAGVGATASVGSTNDNAGLQFAPTLDYRAGKVLVQLHALELIGELPNKFLDFGVDVSGVAVKRKVAEDIEGVFMPGAKALLYSDTGFANPGFHVMAQGRFGAERKQGAGIGLYVVPEIGISNLNTGKMGLAYGGSLQVSMWFANGGGGDGGGGGGKHRGGRGKNR